ncbi:MAG TPA: F0F1 ATP synthase subunit A [Sandaracinaceae bacterium LLY-WYZ-13_1]|nr:F0F1 ATP synthase subunit A [Sandaracinaceae bacterium LLY-WYZ-13_1]
MRPDLLPTEVARVGPFGFTDTLLATVVLSAVLVGVGALLMRFERTRAALEVVYEGLERSIVEGVQIDARPLVPLVLTQWVFILFANLLGLVPTLSSPTRDLSITASLALIAFFAGHVYAFRAQGVRYLKHYLEPNPLLLPFNVVGELSRTLALALRLFGNMLSGHLIGAILVYLVGLLVPIPMLLLSVLTSVVQAYIFGVLTLVFTASSMAVASREQETSTPQGAET